MSIIRFGDSVFPFTKRIHDPDAGSSGLANKGQGSGLCIAGFDPGKQSVFAWCFCFYSCSLVTTPGAEWNMSANSISILWMGTFGPAALACLINFNLKTKSILGFSIFATKYYLFTIFHLSLIFYLCLYSSSYYYSLLYFFHFFLIICIFWLPCTNYVGYELSRNNLWYLVKRFHRNKMKYLQKLKLLIFFNTIWNAIYNWTALLSIHFTRIAFQCFGP